MPVLLLVLAALFAVVAGANDGSAIVAAGLRAPGPRPITQIALLLAALLLGPTLLFGTRVASTLAERLVPFGGGQQGVVLVAIVVSVGVVFTLARAGLPTSLTLALMGAITGAGLGAGLPVQLAVLGEVALAGLLAPVLAGALGFALTRGGLRMVGGWQATRRARRLHLAAYCLQCLAYSANGGQKMLAVFAIAAGTAGSAGWRFVLAAAGLFGLGLVAGVRRAAANLSQGILAVHLRHALVAEICSSVVVAGGGLAGIPLTMSQAVSGGLIGAGASESPSRIRWATALRLAGAWLVTLPASIAAAALGGVLVRWAG
ncbi:inorganic phosphate transporter [Actinocatenispora sera]|uniref:Phosphate transporter n=1 Tax=Actinocatenispora sera TaxID=390989 RepID=A0A810L850_9ACTN|nr:inorganic phosphate transporter [Actinocatenispora sera]BCJ31714.1 phosphate transporter [Actinocatenispora sera]